MELFREADDLVLDRLRPPLREQFIQMPPRPQPGSTPEGSGFGTAAPPPEAQWAGYAPLPALPALGSQWQICKMKKSKDAILHSLASILGCGILVFATTPWTFMAVANALFWLGREFAQKPTAPNTWSWHKHIEWIMPAVAGVTASYVTNLFL